MATAGRIDIDINADASDAIRDLDRVGDEAERAGRRTRRGANDVNDGSRRMSRGFGGAGSAAANMGNQIQDMTVQLQGGTQWTVVLAQQLPQMTAGLGGAAAVAGAAAAIGFAALGVALKALVGESKTVEEAVTDLEAAIADVEAMAKLAGLSARELAQEFMGLGNELDNLVFANATISLREMRDAASDLTDSLLDMYNGNAWLNTSRAEDLYRAFGAAVVQSEDFTNALGDLRNAANLEDQVDAATRLRMAFEAAVGPVEQMSTAQFEYFSAMVDTETQLRRVLDRTKDLDEAVTQTADNAILIEAAMTAVTAGIDGAVGRATALRDRLGEAAAAFDAAAVINRSFELRGEVGRGGAGAGGPLVGSADQQLLSQGQTFFNQYDEPKTSGGRGGRDRGNAERERMERELEALQESLMTKAELEKHDHERRLELLREAREAELLTNQEYNELEEDLKKQHNARMVDLDVWKYGSLSQKADAFFGEAAKLQKSGNDKLAKIGEAAAKIQIAREGVQSASSAWQKGMAIGGPPVAAAFAAVSVAKTAALLAQVGRGSGGGGGFGGAGAGVAASAETQAPRGITNVSLNSVGGDFVRSSDLIDIINQAERDGNIIRVRQA